LEFYVIVLKIRFLFFLFLIPFIISISISS